MTSHALLPLTTAALSVAVVHTLLGPDHYLPFVAMARAGSWSTRKTIAVTLLCGTGHVLSSIVLGGVGVAVGLTVFQLETVEATRGDLAGWLLLAFGAVYFAWGLRRAMRKKTHTHWHAHADGTVHAHQHDHTGDHAHVHLYDPERTPLSDQGRRERPSAWTRAQRGQGAPRGASRGSCRSSDIDLLTSPHRSIAGEPNVLAGADHTVRKRPVANLTPWVLFTIFIFGPCEPLIPILMYAAARTGVAGVAFVTLAFAAATLAVMLAAVLIACRVSSAISIGRFERLSHAFAGFVVLVCGIAVKAGL